LVPDGDLRDQGEVTPPSSPPPPSTRRPASASLNATARELIVARARPRRIQRRKDEPAARASDVDRAIQRKEHAVSRARLSLFYLAGYLIPAGFFLLLVPEFALKLLFSNGRYDDVFTRMTGMMLIGLGIVVVQIIRYRIEILYPTTLAIRAFFVAVLLGLYRHSNDPFFLVLVAIVSFGMALTCTAWLSDRKASSKKMRNATSADHTT
jgi:hypothetical protein